MEIQDNRKINQLTFTRFIAALAIVVYHYGYKIFPFNLKLLNKIILNGSVGVSYFFILSGFVLIVSYLHRVKNGKISYFNFYLNRFARIYPFT